MSIIRQLTALSFIAALSSCGLGDSDENYDTAGGYDTSDPYGVPSDGGVESAPYQAVNPPADSNPTYGAAAYEEAAPTTMPAGPSTPPATASTHTVAKGDTLWGLSKQYGVSQEAIRAVNGMGPDDNNVRLGQSINIPAQ
ncbi:LysM peptidoglycan-binding domain-containing protein [Haloferula sp.]|uniref:LysM peptidoglycan-binding domain-containing protein n=1 Tax=Haloferula sp. TaxID=2497595 RepID=UPI00329EE177